MGVRINMRCSLCRTVASVLTSDALRNSSEIIVCDCTWGRNQGAYTLWYETRLHGR